MSYSFFPISSQKRVLFETPSTIAVMISIAVRSWFSCRQGVFLFVCFVLFCFVSIYFEWACQDF